MACPTLDHIRETFAEISNIPTPATGRILTDESQPELFRVETKWNQRDITRGDSYPFNRSYFIRVNESHEMVSPDSIISCPASSNESDHLWEAWSPSETLRATILKHKSKDQKKDEQYILQVWSSQQLVKSINLTDKDKHGKVYDNDCLFGCFAWSHDEGHLVYVAEEKVPKKYSHFSSKAKSEGELEDSKEGKADEKYEIGTEYDYQDDWGEQMTGKIRSVLCVLDLETETVLTIDNVPENICCGQAIWCPKDTGFIFIGVDSSPYRLGAMYCEQRAAAVYHLDLASGTCQKLSKNDYSACSPRFSPNGHSLVWLENKMHGPHRQCKRLMMVDWVHSKEPHTVIDFIHKAGEGGFPGIYCQGLPRRCWSADSRRIIFHSEWRSQAEIMVVHTQSKLGCRLPADSIAIGTASVVDVHNDLILAVQSSPSRPNHFVVAQLPHIGNEESVQWVRLPDQPEVVEGINWTILTHVPDEHNEHPEFGRAEYQSVLVCPDISETSCCSEFAKLGSLVVLPHGGPHGVSLAQFVITPVALVRLGFSVLLVNYRGSTGFGQDSVVSLPGRIGTMDVLDCQKAAEEVINSQEFNIDKNRVCVYGGSHGGFLTIHLIGQFPDFYKAASCRNPVINIASMCATTDIIDWTFVEAGFSFQHDILPTPDILKIMWEVSPLRYADNIHTPLLLAVGAKDRRVPPKQALELYKALLARGRKVKMSLYPEECHPIGSVPASSDAFVNMVKWFIDHLSVSG